RPPASATTKRTWPPSTADHAVGAHCPSRSILAAPTATSAGHYLGQQPVPEADPMVRARRAAVGGRMRELRKQAGLTQEAVAGAAGLIRQFYLVVEAGQRTLSLDNVFPIADALSADPRELSTELPPGGLGPVRVSPAWPAARGIRYVKLDDWRPEYPGLLGGPRAGALSVVTLNRTRHRRFRLCRRFPGSMTVTGSALWLSRALRSSVSAAHSAIG